MTDAPDDPGKDHAEHHSVSFERRDCNDLSPIGKLPEDILLNIFMLYLDLSRSNSPYCQNPICSVYLTHVCSFWRAIAIEYPPLWNVIDLGWPLWRMKHVPRAKQLPLVVFYCRSLNEEPPLKEVVQYLFQQDDHRIGVSDFNLRDAIIPCRWMDDVPTSSIVGIKKLIFRCSDIKRFPQIAHTRYESLQHLTVSSYDDFREQGLTMFLPGLHTLDLKTLSPEGQIHWTDCLVALNAMSQLKYLRLDSILQGTAQGTSPRVHPVTLPSLVTLTVHDITSDCLALLEYIVCPSLATINLVLRLDHGQDIQSCIEQLKSVVSKVMKDAPFPPLTSIDSFCLTFVRLGFGTSSSSHHHLEYHTPGVHLALSGVLKPQHACNVLQRLGLTSLDYLAIREHQLPSYIDLLMSASSVTTLRIPGDLLHHLCYRLKPSQGDDGSSTQPFPALNRLEVEDLRILEYTDPIMNMLEELTTAFHLRSSPPSGSFVVNIGRIDGDTILLLNAIAKGVLASFMKTITNQGLEKKVWFSGPERRGLIEIPLGDWRTVIFPWVEAFPRERHFFIYDVYFRIWVE